MGTRAVDLAHIGLLFIAPIFLGSVFLLVDIPIFNPVSPFTLAAAVSGLIMGLIFGVFLGRWFTEEQLRVLAFRNEFRGLGSKKINGALFVGLAIFSCLFISIFFFITNPFAIALGNSLVLFTISATFTLFISRMLMIRSWESREEKIVMMEWNKVYAIPYPPQF